jgi:superfamily II DNA or RNA helicase
MTREELKKQILTMAKTNSKIAIQWGTSVGKSKAAIDVANQLYENNSNLKILLIVAEVPHKKNWIDEFKKWNLKAQSITIECYASLKKYKGTEWDLIIFDEAHHLGSDLRLSILTEIKVDNVVLLSATLPESLFESLYPIYGKFAISKVSLQDAIEYGFLPEPKIYLIPLTLDNTKTNQVIIEEWGKKEKRINITCTYYERWKYLKNRNSYPNICLSITCTPLQKYQYLSEKFEFWKRSYLRMRQEHMKNKWLQIGSTRKRFLGECKTEAVNHLLYKLKDRRLICFCSSIEQAEILGKNNAIHSEKNNSLEIIDNFNTKKSNRLFAVGMLQEGQNLVDIEAGIIVQLDGKERAFIQKFGRSMRAKDPIQYIFYYKNTRDEEYLNKILEEIDPSYISYLTI